MDDWDIFKMNGWEVTIRIVLLFLIGLGSLYLTDLYFSSWRMRSKILVTVICWSGCSVGVFSVLERLRTKNKKD